ncbi:BRISC and BRCA1-A complex member 1 isoform X3 [Cinclus cinclus]|uniref:BRISC and BRCA1-A complex member 1 isoform X3 n=1 Tax=Cinclus cinclus TaxID=127875 RepID=UPI002E10EDAF
MDTPEPGSAAEDEEEKVPEVRPRTRSNPEGAEDRGQPGVGNRSEGEGEAASAGHSPQASPGQGSAWHGPAEVQVKTPRVNCPEKVIICLDLAEEMALPKLESFNGQQKIELPVTDNVQTIPPPFVVRTILVFGRPRCQPQFCGGDHVKKLLQCPYFFFDVVYIHNGQDDKEDEGSWKDMFGFFGSLDTKGTNYKYEVALAGPALELHNCMAKLLAHPLQRPCQSHAAYGLLDGGDSPDSEATV